METSNPSPITAHKWIASCRPADWHQGPDELIQPLCLRCDCWIEGSPASLCKRDLSFFPLVPKWEEPCWKKPLNASPGWPMSLCTGAYSPAVTLSISSSLRRSALTGDTLATWPSWPSASMETLITSGCEPWRGGSPESAPGWFSANCCWTKALRRLWPPVSSTRVRWIQLSRPTFNAKTRPVEAQLGLRLGRDTVRI